MKRECVLLLGLEGDYPRQYRLRIFSPPSAAFSVSLIFRLLRIVSATFVVVEGGVRDGGGERPVASWHKTQSRSSIASIISGGNALESSEVAHQESEITNKKIPRLPPFRSFPQSRPGQGSRGNGHGPWGRSGGWHSIHHSLHFSAKAAVSETGYLSVSVLFNQTSTRGGPTCDGRREFWRGRQSGPVKQFLESLTLRDGDAASNFR